MAGLEDSFLEEVIGMLAEVDIRHYSYIPEKNHYVLKAADANTEDCITTCLEVKIAENYLSITMTNPGTNDLLFYKPYVERADIKELYHELKKKEKSVKPAYLWKNYLPL